jgi:hypothetical protein
MAADRGLAAADASGDPLVLGSLYRSVAHCLLATDRPQAAAALVDTAGEVLTSVGNRADADYQSVYGTLFLVGAMAAARVDDRGETRRYLAHARAAAERLGHDANHMWTAFGPTTVAMHDVSTGIELGDVDLALDRGVRIDTSALPIERRARLSLDLARAHHARARRESALAYVLDAEELAPEQVRHHFIARTLVTGWVKTAKHTPGADLAGLARRLRIT